MELRHIRYFVAVAEELNFTRAAARLGIGQPPLSQQIKDLEAELGVTLLRRVPHGAELTEAGRMFLKRGRLALAAATDTAVAAQRAARGELGHLELGFTSSAHFSAVVPTAIRRFAERFPEVALRLSEANTHKLLERLMLGTLDLAFTHSGLEEDPRFHVVSIKVDPLVAVLPRSHRCASGSTVLLASLAEDAFIMKPSDAGPALHRAVREACRSVGFEPRFGQEATQLATVISFVSAGLGVSLVPASMQQMQAVGVVYRPTQDVQAQISLALTWRRHERSKVVGNFVALARMALAAD